MPITLRGNGNSTFSSGNLSLGDGNLVVADGHGIDFSATANSNGTTNSELLADYEEGVWEPRFFNNNNGATTVSTGTRAAKYIKVGRMVHLSCYIQCSSKGTNTVQNLSVDNLPFASDANGQLHGGLTVAFWATATSAMSFMTATVQPNGNTVFIRGNGAAGGTTVLTLNGNSIGDGFDLILGGCYIAAQ